MLAGSYSAALDKGAMAIQISLARLGVCQVKLMQPTQEISTGKVDFD